MYKENRYLPTQYESSPCHNYKISLFYYTMILDLNFGKEYSSF